MSTIQIALIPLIPLFSFVLLGLFGRKYLSKYSGWIGTMGLLISAVLSALTAAWYFSGAGMQNGAYQPIRPFNFTWLEFYPGVSIDMGILLDPVSVMMLVVVTFVSLMVHVFSLGYMHGEQRFATYYAFLSLFTFSMLGLVMSTNIFQIYMFWELVGVSSFLLIGFYFEKPSAVAASKKAFIVTRFADLGFLIGILILGFGAETLDFGALIARLGDSTNPFYQSMQVWTFMGMSALTWGLLLVFMGGAGKSAMLPFHIWLPDAMEGPTPVSALIHAATMVVAGVFLVARLFPVYVLDFTAMQVVTWIGVCSALFAAIIACTQTDIKRVLAYSTMSQIGFMMFGLGVSGMGEMNGLGYMASLFHLFTHAFFKSLLFLAAGAVIHMVHSNEMSDMGGLRKLAPVTHAVFLAGCLAIAGIPPFAGFFSKEEILMAAYEHHLPVYIIAVAVSGLTAFYMFRLYFMIFWNKPANLHSDHNEGDWSMKLPMLILGLCSVFAGFAPVHHWITSDGRALETELHPGFAVIPVGLAIAGIAMAAYLYRTESNRPAALAASMGNFYRAAFRKFYFDELYLFITQKILFKGVGQTAAWIDRTMVDGLVNGTAKYVNRLSDRIKGIQSGQLQSYAAYLFAGILGFLLLFIYLWP